MLAASSLPKAGLAAVTARARPRIACRAPRRSACCYRRWCSPRRRPCALFPGAWAGWPTHARAIGVRPVPTHGRCRRRLLGHRAVAGVLPRLRAPALCSRTTATSSAANAYTGILLDPVGQGRCVATIAGRHVDGAGAVSGVLRRARADVVLAAAGVSATRLCPRFCCGLAATSRFSRTTTTSSRGTTWWSPFADHRWWSP